MAELPSSSTPTDRRYEVVGTRPIRHDGVEKVTDQARYGADIRLPGMLYGKVLRSPHAHARIKAIDTRRAEVCPGVYAESTSADRGRREALCYGLAGAGQTASCSSQRHAGLRRSGQIEGPIFEGCQKSVLWYPSVCLRESEV